MVVGFRRHRLQISFQIQDLSSALSERQTTTEPPITIAFHIESVLNLLLPLAIHAPRKVEEGLAVAIKKLSPNRPQGQNEWQIKLDSKKGYKSRRTARPMG
ncbi:hypothetical protein L1987_43261 [Smallanthus sonchifolius]|uniref:Uncharacterized protein n=1 Tax=Smallanthus sonchifolius TaxID=185202 RepID=A0ACB9GN67_9ASTR|nr:hypothetical protein L1987_43261 [Smallanthus sonchifolius]